LDSLVWIPVLLVLVLAAVTVTVTVAVGFAGVADVAAAAVDDGGAAAGAFDAADVDDVDVDIACVVGVGGGVAAVAAAAGGGGGLLRLMALLASHLSPYSMTDPGVDQLYPCSTVERRCGWTLNVSILDCFDAFVANLCVHFQGAPLVRIDWFSAIHCYWNLWYCLAMLLLSNYHT
jgi:hypothetical protein